MPLKPAPHIHVATVDGDLVLLDAVHDDYLCIGRYALAPSADAADAGPALPDTLAALLVEQRLMVRSDRPDWPAAIARQARSDLRNRQSPSIRLRDLVTLVLSATRAIWWLRFRSPARWFTDLERHPLRRTGTAPACQEAALRFRRLRPLIPRSGRCLIQSMHLLHFLRLQGHAATWVFGVRTFPFEAHCWLERDGVVLDDTAEHVAWFTPIVRLP